MDPGDGDRSSGNVELSPVQVEDVGPAIAAAALAGARAAASAAFGAGVLGLLLSWGSCMCAGLVPGVWGAVLVADTATAFVGALLMLLGRSEIRESGTRDPGRVRYGLRLIVAGSLIGLAPLPMHAACALIAPPFTRGGKFKFNVGAHNGLVLGGPAALAFLVAAFVLLAYGRALQALKPLGQTHDHPGAGG